MKELEIKAKRMTLRPCRRAAQQFRKEKPGSFPPAAPSPCVSSRQNDRS